MCETRVFGDRNPTVSFVSLFVRTLVSGRNNNRHELYEEIFPGFNSWISLSRIFIKKMKIFLYLVLSREIASPSQSYSCIHIRYFYIYEILYHAHSSFQVRIQMPSGQKLPFCYIYLRVVSANIVTSRCCPGDVWSDELYVWLWKLFFQISFEYIRVCIYLYRYVGSPRGTDEKRFLVNV